MLVLSRKEGTEITIGDDIVLTVIRITEHTVRLGISAPRDMAIVRDDAIRKSPASGPVPGACREDTTT